MKVYSFRQRQILPGDLQELWAFFANPFSLMHLTPPWLGLSIQADPVPEIYEGMVIGYRLRPLPSLSWEWITEITHVERRASYTSEQRLGPCRFWHHEHHFRQEAGLVHIYEIVHYTLPYDPLSRLGTVCLQQALQRMFAFRKEAALSYFTRHG